MELKDQTENDGLLICSPELVLKFKHNMKFNVACYFHILVVFGDQMEKLITYLNGNCDLLEVVCYEALYALDSFVLENAELSYEEMAVCDCNGCSRVAQAYKFILEEIAHVYVALTHCRSMAMSESKHTKGYWNRRKVRVISRTGNVIMAIKCWSEHGEFDMKFSSFAMRMLRRLDMLYTMLDKPTSIPRINVDEMRRCLLQMRIASVKIYGTLFDFFE